MRAIVPVLLGLFGLVPFVAGAAAITLLPALVIPAGFYTLKIYALVILAFLGGVHWGRALSSGNAFSFVWSVVPSLVGLGAAFLPPPLMFALLAAGFLLAGAVDIVVFARSGPRWYMWLRVVLTLVVVAILLYASALSDDWRVDPFGTIAGVIPR